MGGGRPTLSIEETAQLLGISRWLTEQAIRRGEIPSLRIGRRVLVPLARLQAMLDGTADTVRPATQRRR